MMEEINICNNTKSNILPFIKEASKMVEVKGSHILLNILLLLLYG